MLKKSDQALESRLADGKLE
jgi:hypothetical protein